jgi:hypothetical protein
MYKVLEDSVKIDEFETFDLAAQFKASMEIFCPGKNFYIEPP